MPSRKQRRRREKLKRHEYEYVVETEEGEEIPLEELRERDHGPSRERRGDQRLVDARGREVPRPSLGRVLRRTAIFGPLIVGVVWLTSQPDATTAQRVTTSLMFLLFFIPFSYVVDVLVYRMLMRRHERARAGRARS